MLVLSCMLSIRRDEINNVQVDCIPGSSDFLCILNRNKHTGGIRSERQAQCKVIRHRCIKTKVFSVYYQIFVIGLTKKF